jgi:hypothetical protein
MSSSRFRAVLTTAVVSLLLLLRTNGASADERVKRHAIYVEALGKGGLWGVGYDHQVTPRLGWGVAASFFIVDTERVTSVSPYLVVNVLGNQRHHWFVHLGPQVVHVAIPSPVPEWDGTSRTGVGGEISTGWEYRNGVVLRLFVMAAGGKGGVSPWLGASLGWTL